MKKKTIEDYVELIYILQNKNKRVHTNDIASILKIKPASVTEIFKKLSDGKYINYEKYAGVTLTRKGRGIAKKTKEKHDTLKEFLLLLGVNENIADEDACNMEHFLHSDTMNMIVRFVENVKKYSDTPFWLK